MILYNVTVNLDESIHNDWLQWMRNVHIPEVMDTGMFVEHKLFRLLTRQPDESGVTYSVQYFAESLRHYDKYMREFAPKLQEEHARRYAGKFVAFRTLLEEA